jgi:hypothetical protein
MKLLTKEIINKMPINTDGQTMSHMLNTKFPAKQVKSIEECRIVVKFFGGGSYTLYVVSAEAFINGQDAPVNLKDAQGKEIEDIHFYGYVTGLQFDEWGRTSFNELKAIKFPPFNLPVERDMYFGEHTIKELKETGTIK